MISVAKLTFDKNVFMEFHPFFVFVNNQKLKKVLLRGILKDGMYRVCPRDVAPSMYTFSLGFFNYSVSSIFVTDLWHLRLGHLLPLIMNKVFRYCNNFFLRKRNSSCDSCQLGKNHRLFAPPSMLVSHVPLELTFFYVWGLTLILSRVGFWYY